MSLRMSNSLNVIELIDAQNFIFDFESEREAENLLFHA